MFKNKKKERKEKKIYNVRESRGKTVFLLEGGKKEDRRKEGRKRKRVMYKNK